MKEENKQIGGINRKKSKACNKGAGTNLVQLGKIEKLSLGKVCTSTIFGNKPWCILLLFSAPSHAIGIHQ